MCLMGPHNVNDRACAYVRPVSSSYQPPEGGPLSYSWIHPCSKAVAGRNVGLHRATADDLTQIGLRAQGLPK